MKREEKITNIEYAHKVFLLSIYNVCLLLNYFSVTDALVHLRNNSTDLPDQLDEVDLPDLLDSHLDEEEDLHLDEADLPDSHLDEEDLLDSHLHEEDLHHDEPVPKQTINPTTTEARNVRMSESEQHLDHIARELRTIKAAVGRINDGVDCDILPLTLRGGIKVDDGKKKPSVGMMRKKETTPTPLYGRMWFVAMVSFICSTFFTMLSTLIMMVFVRREVKDAVEKSLQTILDDDSIEMRTLQARSSRSSIADATKAASEGEKTQ